ncbi:MAG: NADH-quinone oxidoreductase subunit F, partial [Armatimonadota bacterium]
KDRILMESDPHALLEGMAIAGHAVGAQRGFIFVQAEYALAAATLRAALRGLRKAGICGPRVLGTGFSFDIEVRSGVGSYVCGEESGALECMEGRSGRPRVRPPYPAEKGFLGQPTAVNNVETLANVPLVLRLGAAAYRAMGAERSPGTKIFTLSGNVRRPGAYELPLGTPLQDLLEMAGGPREGKRIPAVLIGGPTGGFVPGDSFHYPLDFESLREIGAMMGSGGIIALRPSCCVIEVVRHMVAFMEEESCGTCVPCRIGVRQMRLLLDKIVGLRATCEDLEVLRQISEALPLAALCGLGQAAPNPILSSLRHFKDEYDAHVLDHNCTAHPKRKRRAATPRSGRK